TPDLLTGLFVAFRDLITAPQMAAYNIQEGFLNTLGTLSLTPFLDALQVGITDVFNAIIQFPGAVIDAITGALGDSAGAAGAVAGDTSETLADALASLI
ncbi:MAG: histidine phosphatase family protein, partial [Mycobacterium sp.]